MENKELVSIVIECYNHEKYIADCLESIVNQTYENIELIICDDCSTDRSFDIISACEGKMRNRFKRLVIYRNDENIGVIRTLNNNLVKVKGKYIKDCASDDILLSNCIEDNYQYLLNNKEKDIVVSNGYFVNDEYKLNQNDFNDIIYKELPDFETENLFQKLYFSNYIYAPCVMLRRKVFDEFGLYDENIAIEDWEYWLRVTREKKIGIGYLDQYCVLYRRSLGSLSTLAENADLEKRRLYMHAAEMLITDKYGNYLSKQLFARKKFWILLQEYRLAKAHCLIQLCHIVCDELKEFNQNQKKYLRIKDRMAYEWFKFKEYKKEIQYGNK